MKILLNPILFLLVSLLFACGNPIPTPPPLGLEPTFAVGPTFVLTPAPDPGRLIFSTKGCSGCHTIEGTSTATIGPDLTHIATVAATRKAPLSAEEYILESIKEPGVFVVEGFEPLMPKLAEAIAEGELEDLVEFLLDQE